MRLATLSAAALLTMPLVTGTMSSVRAETSPAVQGQAFPGYMAFQVRYLAVLSDADMVASAYLDGNLGPRSPEMRDELTLFPLRDGLPGEPPPHPGVERRHSLAFAAGAVHRRPLRLRRRDGPAGRGRGLSRFRCCG